MKREITFCDVCGGPIESVYDFEIEVLDSVVYYVGDIVICEDCNDILERANKLGLIKSESFPLGGQDD